MEEFTLDNHLEEAEIPMEYEKPVRNRRRFGFPRTQMSAINTGHIIEVLRAAMPYVDSRSQGPMESLLKATDLIHTTHQQSAPASELSAASLNSRPADIEGMLCSIREVGSVQERDIIDKMLNCFKAKKLYQTYMMFNQNKDQLQAASLSGQNGHNFNTNSNMIEAFKSILPPDQAANLDNLNMIMNAMNVMNSMGMNRNNTGSYTSYSNPTYPSQNTVTPPETITNDYLNQFAPNTSEKANAMQPSAPTNPTNQQAINPGDTANMYNNVMAVYNALSTSGLLNSNSTNQNGQNAMSQQNPNAMAQTIQNMMSQMNQQTSNSYGQNGPNDANQNSTNNMMNMLSSLINSGMLQNNTSSRNQNTQENIPNSNTNSTSSNPSNSRFGRNNITPLKSVPIPKANDTVQKSTSSTSKASTSFNPDDIYPRLNAFRNMSDWSRKSNTQANYSSNTDENTYDNSIVVDNAAYSELKDQDSLEAASLDQSKI